MNFNLKAIGEHSYTWAEGFSLSNRTSNTGNKQIDWATIKQIVESNEFDRIEVGLAEDYYQTHAVIFKNNELVKEENDGAGFYGCSRWATPAVKLTKNGKTGLFECYIQTETPSETFPEWMDNVKIISPWDDGEY